MPEGVAVYRWLTERYEPTMASIPDHLRTRLVDADVYNQVPDHLWFLPERAGHDIGRPEVTKDHVDNVLSGLSE